MNAAAKGRRSEHKARAILRAAGYEVCRAAGSKGTVDLVAWSSTAIRFAAVKSGGQYLAAVEREALARLPRPANATVELWRFPDRCREPLIEVLRNGGGE